MITLGNILQNRTLVTKLTTNSQEIVKSKSYNITYDMAQGSCLGPLLFILFSNDMYLLPTYSKIIFLADDTSLLDSHRSLKFLQYTMEHDMVLLTDWYRVNKLSLYMNKTVPLKFWSDKEPFKLNVNGVEICNTTKTKILGVTLNDRLTWRDHVNEL